SKVTGSSVEVLSVGAVVVMGLSSQCALRRAAGGRSEEHTSELQSRFELVCRLLLEKKNEIEIEQNDNDTIDAQIEDDINDEYLTGTDAFNTLYPMLKELSINQDTNKEDTIEDDLTT